MFLSRLRLPTLPHTHGNFKCMHHEDYQCCGFRANHFVEKQRRDSSSATRIESNRQKGEATLSSLREHLPPGQTLTNAEEEETRPTCLIDSSRADEEVPQRNQSLQQSRRAWLLAATGSAAIPSSGRSSEAVTFHNTEFMRLAEAAPPQSQSVETGIVALRNPALYRGAATEKAARKAYKLDGLLPASRASLQREVTRAKQWIDHCCTPLDKYQALMTLKETNRDAFFGVLAQNLTAYLPIVYTPTVGTACQEWSHLLHRPTGLYITINDLGNVRRVINNWPEEAAKIAVITDGERILGLGDLGVSGIGISIGKTIVHSAAGGIQPRLLIPIVLDVGCNNAAIREDPLYLGLKQERVRGAKFDALVDEVVKALTARYGASLLVHWEDFSSKNSYRLLARARAQGVSTFNDDIESTAAAVLAAVMGATRLRGVPPLEKQTFLMLGAGQANIGGARLLAKALQAEGLGETAAKARIWLFDSKGIVYEGRDEGKLSAEKQEFQRSTAEGQELQGLSFAQAVQRLSPTAIIGAAAKRNTFSEEVIQHLQQGVEAAFGRDARPIVLALSNPDTVAECTAREAYEWSDGKAAYASGTSFPAFQREDGSQYIPAQANNSFIFPGVGLGCIASGATAVTDDMMLAAGRAVARKLTKQELGQGSILPATERLREVALSVAAAVAMTAAESMVAKRTSDDVLECLPLGKSAEDPAALKQAEACIAKLRYDAFAEDQPVPNPVNPILL